MSADKYPRNELAEGRVQRFDLDAAGKPCSEGYYAVDPKQPGVVLMPPGAEFPANDEQGKRRGLRLATLEDVMRGPITQAWSEHIAGHDPSPSDRKPDEPAKESPPPSKRERKA